jgi:DNA-binding transcriptional MerR regulator
MAELARIPLDSTIPDKLYFRIGEVSRLTGIKPYVLRFWENQFNGLGPRKSGKGHRLFRRKDVELVLEIKHLLYERRYTIEGARKWLENRGKTPALKPEPPTAQGKLFPTTPAGYDTIRRELASILELLK